MTGDERGRPADGRGTAAGSEPGDADAEPDYRPGRHTRLRAGDELLVVGPVTQVVELVRRNQPGHAGSGSATVSADTGRSAFRAK